MSPRRNVPIIDALPEHYPYRDDGCDVSPSCLGCPVPWCKYDDPVAYHRELREGRDREVVQAKRAQGNTVPELARRFGVSQRTIHRILERARRIPETGPTSSRLSTTMGSGRSSGQEVVRQAQRKGCSPYHFGKLSAGSNLPPKTGEGIAVLPHQVATLRDSLATTIDKH